MNNCEKILAFMNEHGRITAQDAEAFGCHRLAARISDLKEAGHNIVTLREPNETVGWHGVYVFGAAEEMRGII